MTNRDAIERLIYIKMHQIDPEDYEVFDFAIKSLKREVQWENDNAFREKKWGKQNDQ